MLDFCFAFLEYISFLSCRVLYWFDENSVVIEKYLRLIQILIVEKKKKINDFHFQKFHRNSTDIHKKYLNKNLINKNEFDREFRHWRLVECRVVEKKLIMKLKNIHDYESKSKQLKIVICILNDRDCIFFVKTEYEKSMILYSSSTLRMNTIILLIMSLNALQNDQKNFIVKMNSKINFCVLNDEIITKKLLNEIKYETYIHILINSKIALFNESFRKILQSSIFRERLALVAIDETHLVKNWSNWRFDYERLDELRSMLFRIIFFFFLRSRRSWKIN
jgi:superfamily II DNA helicase RecQ